MVTPDEQSKEAPYITHNIAATRAAFDLDGIEERELSGDATLTMSDIESNSETLNNVRLWDHEPLLDTFGQIQEIRTYYQFASVDNDRYMVDGEYRQTMLSARELNSNSLPNRSWINEHLQYTHGFGVAMGPVNEVTQEGLPVAFSQRPTAPFGNHAVSRSAKCVLRGALERLRHRQYQHRRVSLPRR